MGYKKDRVSNVYYSYNNFKEIESVSFVLEKNKLQFSFPIKHYFIRDDDDVVVRIVHKTFKNKKGDYQLKFIYCSRTQRLVVSPNVWILNTWVNSYLYLSAWSIVVYYFFIFLLLTCYDLWVDRTIFWSDNIDFILDSPVTFIIFLAVLCFILVMNFAGFFFNIHKFSKNIKTYQQASLDKIILSDTYKVFDFKKPPEMENFFSGEIQTGTVNKTKVYKYELDVVLNEINFDSIVVENWKINLKRYRMKINEHDFIFEHDVDAIELSKEIKYYTDNEKIFFIETDKYVFFDYNIVFDFFIYKQNFKKIFKSWLLIYLLLNLPFFLLIFFIDFSEILEMLLFSLTLLFAPILISAILYNLRYLDLKKIKFLKKCLNASWLNTLLFIWSLQKRAVPMSNLKNSYCWFYKKMG